MPKSISLRKTIKSVAIFYLLSIVLLALVPIFSALFGLSMDFDGLVAVASEQNDIPWTSNLINVIRLALVEPSLWLYLIGAAVPTLAALLVLLGTRNRAGFVLLLKRFNPLGLNRVPRKSAAGSYALLTFGILLCRSVSCWFRDIIGQDYQRDSLSLTRGLLFAILISSLLDLGAITEEVG